MTTQTVVKTISGEVINSSVTKPSVGPVHHVLRTSQENLAKLVEWYQIAIGAHVQFATEHISFLTFDEEHHRIAIAAVPNIQEAPKGVQLKGVWHIAYTYATLAQLFAAYRERKRFGIEPYWCINHGPTVSMYYKDLDGNTVEMQVDTMDAEGANAFFRSEEFSENPVGVEYVPEDMIARLEAGEAESVLMKRPNIGKRDFEKDHGPE